MRVFIYRSLLSIIQQLTHHSQLCTEALANVLSPSYVDRLKRLNVVLKLKSLTCTAIIYLFIYLFFY